MGYLSITLFPLLLLLNHIECKHLLTCQKISPCACQFPHGVKLDLSPIDSKDSNNPTFADISPDTGNSQFSWNPCTAFNEGNCTSVSVCEAHQNDKGTAEYFSIGTQDSAGFSYNSDGVLQITYVFEDTKQKIKRSSFIALKCTKESNMALEAKGENPPGSGQFYFELTSPFSCYPTPGGEHVGLSTGSFLCIGFFAVILIYIIGGVVFQSAVRKSKGLDRIPNVHFWFMIPGLVKDGTVFVFTRGKRTSYSKI